MRDILGVLRGPDAGEQVVPNLDGPATAQIVLEAPGQFLVAGHLHDPHGEHGDDHGPIRAAQ